MRVLSLFILLTLYLSACQSSVDAPISNPHFFDLKAFFKKELVKLESIKQVKKEATVDGKLETKTVSDTNFEEELALFIDSDINKISWMDRYEVDSLFEANQLRQISYKAKDHRLKTNSLTVQFEQDEVSHIAIIRKTSSIAAELEQSLTYTPSKGYAITSKQQTSLSTPHVLALNVQFLQ